LRSRRPCMADWKTYAKAARNTARKQAPEVKRSAQESVRRDDERFDDEPFEDRTRDGERPPASEDRREYDPRPAGARPEPEPAEARHRHAQRGRRPDGIRGSDGDRRPALDADSLRRGAAAYYTVAERRVRGAQLGP